MCDLLEDFVKLNKLEKLFFERYKKNNKKEKYTLNII